MRRKSRFRCLRESASRLSALTGNSPRPQCRAERGRNIRRNTELKPRKYGDTSVAQDEGRPPSFRMVLEKVGEGTGMNSPPRSATGSPTNHHRPMSARSATGSGRRRSSIGPSCRTGSRHLILGFSRRIGSMAARIAAGPCATGRPRRSVRCCRNTGCFRCWWSWGEQNERSSRGGVIPGARSWSSSTMKPKHTPTGNC